MILLVFNDLDKSVLTSFISILQNESNSYFTSLKSIYHIASKSIQSEIKKVEVVEIQDEKPDMGEVNGILSEQKTKNDTRWGDTKISVKKEEVEKDKKSDNKTTVKKESIEDEKKN